MQSGRKSTEQRNSATNILHTNFARMDANASASSHKNAQTGPLVQQYFRRQPDRRKAPFYKWGQM